MIKTRAKHAEKTVCRLLWLPAKELFLVTIRLVPQETVNTSLGEHLGE